MALPIVLVYLDQGGPIVSAKCNEKRTRNAIRTLQSAHLPAKQNLRLYDFILDDRFLEILQDDGIARGYVSGVTTACPLFRFSSWLNALHRFYGVGG